MLVQAELKDIPTIKAMAEIVFRQTYKEIISPQQMEYMMEMMYSEHSLEDQMTQKGHVYYLDDSAKGYVSYRFDRRDSDGVEVYHLEKIYVLPEFQHTGLGLVLFNKIVEEVRSHSGGKARIELNVNRNNPAVSFYERLGMKKAITGDFPIGNGFFMNDYIMVIDVI